MKKQLKACNKYFLSVGFAPGETKEFYLSQRIMIGEFRSVGTPTDSAKTEETKMKRIEKAIESLQ